MTSRNAATPATAETVNGRQKADRLGRTINSKNSKNPRGRQARGPASIYSGRIRLGSIEPGGGGYRAFDADGNRIGQFATFDEAASAVSHAGSGA